MLPYHLHGITQHALVQYCSGIAIQNSSHDPFYGSRFVWFYSSEIPSCSIRHLFSVDDPVSHLDSSLFSSGIVGECLIFREAVRTWWMPAVHWPSNSALIFKHNYWNNFFFSFLIQQWKKTAEAHVRPGNSHKGLLEKTKKCPDLKCADGVWRETAHPGSSQLCLALTVPFTHYLISFDPGINKTDERNNYQVPRFTWRTTEH